MTILEEEYIVLNKKYRTLEKKIKYYDQFVLVEEIPGYFKYDHIESYYPSESIYKHPDGEECINLQNPLRSMKEELKRLEDKLDRNMRMTTYLSRPDAS